MAISDYLRGLREKIGTDLVLMPSAAGLLFDEQGRVLLALHSNRRVWVVPGGALDPGETPADAAVRETWEETGLYVEPLRITGIYGTNRVRYDNGDVVEYVTTVFECRLLSGTPHPDGEETLDLRYFDRGALDAPDIAPWVRRVVQDALRSETAAAFIPPVWKPGSR